MDFSVKRHIEAILRLGLLLYFVDPVKMISSLQIAVLSELSPK